MKRLNVKLQLLIMTLVPMFIIGIVLTTISVTTLRKNMMKEALDGLQAACNLYRQEVITTSRDLTTNELEDEYKAVTGYDFTRFEGDTRAATSVVKTDGTRPIGTKAAPEVVTAVITGNKEYTSEKTDVAGQSYCVAYSPIMTDGKVTGMAFAGKPRKEMDAVISSATTIILVICILIVAIATVIIYIIALKFVEIIKAVEDALSSLKNGEFTTTDTFTDRQDEFGDIIRSSNELSEHLKTIVSNVIASASNVNKQATELSNTANQMSQTCDGVSEAVQEMARGATEQAESVQRSTENLGNLSDAIQTVSDNSESLASTAAEMNDASTQSAEALHNLSKNMESMGEAMRAISATMGETNDAVARVNDKVNGITSIASQTNLLALNASIEAARAGDAGRGFAVVAEEIGKLATESASTAQEIRNEMSQLLEHAEEAGKRTEEISTIGNEAILVLNKTTETINILINNVTTTVSGVNNISALTEECNANKEQIVDAMSSLSAISEENAASTQETGASMQELNATVNGLAEASTNLNDVANKLNEELAFFKV